MASELRAELYLLPVDIVLSRDSLKNFNRYVERRADCCSVAGIECEPAQLRAWLDARGRGATGDLELPAEELLAVAVARPDAYFRSLIMGRKNQSFCRHPRELIWPMANGLFIHSIFMHPVAVSARLMSRPFHPQHENVDFALLPRLLQGDGRLKIIEDAREVAVAQFGPPLTRDEYLDEGFSLKSFMEADLRPKFHPAGSRIRSSFGPVRPGVATAWGAKPVVERSAPGCCGTEALRAA